MRREILVAQARQPPCADEVPVVPETGAEDYFAGEFADKIEAVVDRGRQKCGIYGAQTGGQRGVRAAISSGVTRGRVKFNAQIPSH